MAGAATSVRSWRSAASAQPLLAWRDAQRDALAGALAQAASAWASDWGVAVPIGVHCAAAPGLVDGTGWRSVVFDGQAGGWLRVDAAAPLAAALFADCGPVGRITRQLAAECQQDMVNRLLAVLGLKPSAQLAPGPTMADAGTWSGTVEVSVAAPGSCRLLLRALTVEAWLAAHGAGVPATAHVGRPALVAVLAAAGATRVRLNVALDGCEVDLGTLRGLRVGDVVRTRHRIDFPADVRHGCASLFRAYLGRRDASRAVELTDGGAVATSSTAQELHP